MHTSKLLSPDQLTPAQRLSEVAILLANALIRRHGHNDSHPNPSDRDTAVLLDKPADQCLYGVSANPDHKEAPWLKK